MPSKRSQPLCLPCEGELPWLETSCRQCALPLPAGGTFCGACLARPPPVDRTVAACAYATPISGWVHAGKYQADIASLRILATLLSRAVAASLETEDPPDLITPVPLHWWRHWRRGFNQASELQRFLLQEPRIRDQGLSMTALKCKRTRGGQPQRGLEAEQRRRNMRDAFFVPTPVADKSVAIVDDVVTTGATVNALAGALKKAGATRVIVWCCARTLPPESR